MAQKLTPEEQRLFRLYGKLPNKKDLLQNKLKERKYFDSGDYALSKAGKASDIGVTSIGREHPVPEKIPHIAPPASSHNGTNGNTQEKGQGGGSPVKEHSFLHRETSLNRETNADDIENEDETSTKA
ncbi:Endosulfine-domain-containing protein [Polyplosphaeria fusca]|uniref:mRNA stability protein n=1 Tax=Polyplosphaeria fusca TaxID=682080 RepID=A0A9P4UZH5_9PLEO|nr:Endosulfine-domain-containing protein [Polyplosphaeria fusca]